MKKILVLLLALTLILNLTACLSDTAPQTAEPRANPTANQAQELPRATATLDPGPGPTRTPVVVEYDPDDLATDTGSADVSFIKLEGSSISLNGSGVTVNGSLATITAAGTYDISGVLDDGQIVVDTEDKDTVVLILDGANVTSSASAPIYVRNAAKTVITLADGTENSVADGENYLFEDAETDEPNAAIFSHDDLTINGTGSLTVHAHYNNGIASKDGLKIVSGQITVYAANDGIKGRNSIAVKDGTIVIDAGGDGMQSNNDQDAAKGTIDVEGGTFDITAGGDGIQAETRLSIAAGTFVIASGGGSQSYSSVDSAKGLKAGVDLVVEDGTFEINASDDALHSNESLAVNGGQLLLATGDDGIHADAALVINGGEIDITDSYEGIESAIITINDGKIQIRSSDDGINVVGDNDGAAIPGRMRPDSFAAVGNRYLYINGGAIVVDADGDGLDINGSIQMTQGSLIVHGPVGNMNGALDYDGAFTLTGGFLVAAGSAGMAQAPDTSSTQYVVMHNFASPQAAGTLVHLETQDGQDVLTFVPNKAYQSVVFSSPELKNGATYRLFSGGNSTGTVTDGLYSGGTYAAGQQVTSLTLSSIITGANPWGGGPGGQMPPRGGGRRRP